jgi:hypothetical protein
MSKTICETDKNEIARKAAEPRFECKRCGSVAHKEKHLCKPKRIKLKKEE